jgi:hypothetical protein
MDDPKASIIDDIRAVLKNDHFTFASIQSTDDYTVNGRLFPLCKNIACTSYDGVLIGYGSQLWPAHIHHHDESLGGLGIPASGRNLKEFEDYLHKNHSATLKSSLTSQWITEIILGADEEPVPPTVTPLPSPEAPAGAYRAGSTGFAYDIVQPGETAHLVFQITNGGQSPWSGMDFRFSPLPGSQYGSLPSLPIEGAVPPGGTASFEIEIPDVTGTSLETVEYSMTYRGQPFEETVKGYIFILPKQAQDIEDELRKTIDDWIAQGEQGLQDLLDRILKEIQDALEREAQKTLDDLLRQCLGTNGALVIGALVIYRRRKPRSEK